MGIDKINVSDIIKAHFATLYNHATKKMSVWDVTLFILLPGIAAIFLVCAGIYITENAINVLITAFSIFAALLLNLLLLLFDIARKRQEGQNGLKFDLIKEIYSNISFAILLSMAVVVLLLLGELKLQQVIHLSSLHQVSKNVANFIIYYLVIEFLLTMLMVLKRVNSLLAKEI